MLHIPTGGSQGCGDFQEFILLDEVVDTLLQRLQLLLEVADAAESLVALGANPLETLGEDQHLGAQALYRLL